MKQKKDYLLYTQARKYFWLSWYDTSYLIGIFLSKSKHLSSL